ncbi:MAG: D-2-hydroxyacid dehydrogenase, partial [Bacteroidota bacterium]
MQHHIVVADGYTLNPGDLSWKSLEKFGRVDVFPRSSREKFAERAKNATVLIVNKQPINAEVLASLPKLRCICASATGYNNIDVEACAKLGIPVCNVVGY